MNIRAILGALLGALLACGPALAQRATVPYDFAKNAFGDFEDLPSEENLLITGALPPNVELVEIAVFDDEIDADTDEADILTTGQFTAAGTVGARAFEVPLNYPLTPGRSYTFRISYFAAVDSADRARLYRQVRQTLESYLNLNYTVDDGELELAQSPRRLRRELDAIARESLRRYRVTSPMAFEGFSDVVLQQIDQLDGAPVGQGAPLRNLMQLLDGELRSMLNQDMVVLRTERVVPDVTAEDKPGYFSIVGGYGAAYYGGDLDDLDYGDGAFVGLGFPFSVRKVAPRVLRNAEFSVGVFVNDFEIDGRDFTGPIIGRPLFAGLDYKLFQFVRFNAGAVFLEEDDGDEDMFENISTRVRVRPFVGLSAKLNLTLSLDK